MVHCKAIERAHLVVLRDTGIRAEISGSTRREITGFKTTTGRYTTLLDLRVMFVVDIAIIVEASAVVFAF